jgi:hypothetical protein
MPAPARAKEAPTKAVPLQERIRQRAYDRYVSRGNQSGSELDDWLQAENEIQAGEEQFITETNSKWPIERDG